MSTIRACGSTRGPSLERWTDPITTREWRIMNRSIARNIRRMTRDRLNAVRQLLRQARVHVVEVRNPQNHRERRTDEPRLLVRMHDVVSRRDGAAQDGERQQRVEHDLGRRGADLHVMNEGRTQAAEHP